MDKKMLKESLGVPEGIVESAKLLYENLLSKLEGTNKEDSDDYTYDFEIDNYFKISDFSINSIEVNIVCNEVESFDGVEVANFSVQTVGKIKGEKRPKIKYLSSPVLKLQINFVVPKDDWDFNDIVNFFLQKRTFFIRAFSHEFKHAYDHYKRDTASISSVSEYGTYSSVRLGIPPFDQFLHMMYFIHSTENLVRPSELAAEIKSNNITRTQFLNFLKSDETYKMLKTAQSFSVQKLKKDLIEYIPKIEEIIESLGESVPNSDDEKLNKMLDIFWKSIATQKISNLSGSLVTNPFEALFGFKGGKQKYFENYIKKISRFKDGLSFFEYEENFIRFVANKMIKKISKLYDITKIDESILDWDLYHKINKTKLTKFVNEITIKENSNDSNKLQLFFERIIKPSYPYLVDIESIDDLSDTIDPYIHGNHYMVNIITEKCLSSEEQMEIDTKFKDFFSLLNPNKISSDFQIKDDTVMCFFDCGDGEGFNFSHTYGYKH